MAHTKDSGKRQSFTSGARRDIQEGKPRFDLIPIDALNDYQKDMLGGADLWELVDKTMPPSVEEEPEESTILTVLTGRDDFTFPHPDYRPDLIPHLMINRLAHLYGRGARKYDDNNWQKGIPLRRIYASMFRHMILWAAGDTSEDHLAAVIWNATALMWTEREVVRGNLPEELADAGPLVNE
jgi:hypothetical protein